MLSLRQEEWKTEQATLDRGEEEEYSTTLLLFEIPFHSHLAISFVAWAWKPRLKAASCRAISSAAQPR